MSLSIQTNVSSLLAQDNMRVNSDFQSKTIQRLTSGYRINSSGDDAAGLAVANKFRSDVAELTQGVRNANDGLSQLQIIDGGLNNISKMLDRMKTLATQAASSTFTGDFATLDDEYQSLLGEIDRQAANIGLAASGKYLTNMSVYVGGGSDQTNAQVKFDLTTAEVDSDATNGLGVAGGDLTGSANALTALTAIDAAVKKLGSVQGTIGTAQNQLGYAINLAQSQISNYSAAESRIRDADIAAEAANLTKAQVLQQASIAAMAQANAAPQAVLSLLRG